MTRNLSVREVSFRSRRFHMTSASAELEQAIGMALAARGGSAAGLLPVLPTSYSAVSVHTSVFADFAPLYRTY